MLLEVDSDTNPNLKLERVLAALRQLRVSLVANEYELQEAIKSKLAECQISFAKEYRLAPRSRLDFLVDGGIAVEVKRGLKKPNQTQLLNQLERYAANDEVQAIVVVVDRNVHLPKLVNDKPCVSLGLNKLWGITF